MINHRKGSLHPRCLIAEFPSERSDKSERGSHASLSWASEASNHTFLWSEDTGTSLVNHTLMVAALIRQRSKINALRQFGGKFEKLNGRIKAPIGGMSGY